MKTDPIQDSIIEEFETFPEWFDKYRRLVELGKAFPPIPAELKTEENLLFGCQSNVWICADIRDGRMKYYADSEAALTRGILSLLIRIFDGQIPAEIRDTDLYFLTRIGLSSHLSPNRANGLASIIVRMKELAEKYSV